MALDVNYKVNQGRLRWIDIAKGIGIILVVIAHASDIDSLLWRSINSFHMPLFFILSGYLYKDERMTWRNFRKRFVKKLSNLWLPFALISLVDIFVFSIYQGEIRGTDIINIFLMRDTAPLLGASWFICSFFFAQIGVDFYTLIKNRVLRSTENSTINAACDILFLLVFMVVGLNISSNVIGRCFVGMAYVLLGIIIHSIFIRLKNSFGGGYTLHAFLRYKSVSFFIAVILMGVVINISIQNYVSFAGNIYSNKVLSVVQSIFGFISILIISKTIESTYFFHSISNALIYVGQNTMGIIFFQFISFKVVLLMQMLIYGTLSGVSLADYPVNYEYNSILWILIYTIVGVYFSIFVYRVIDKHIFDRIRSYFVYSPYKI